MIPRKRAVQYFSKEDLERARELTPTEIGEFLEQFRLLYGLREVPPIPEELRDLVDPQCPEHSG